MYLFTAQNYFLLQFFSALYVSANWTVVGCAEICATAIGVFAFVMFLNEDNIIPPSMPHIWSFSGMPAVYLVWTVDIIVRNISFRSVINAIIPIAVAQKA